jgi:hypothetical protein
MLFCSSNLRFSSRASSASPTTLPARLMQARHAIAIRGTITRGIATRIDAVVYPLILTLYRDVMQGEHFNLFIRGYRSNYSRIIFRLAKRIEE